MASITWVLKNLQMTILCRIKYDLWLLKTNQWIFKSKWALVSKVTWARLYLLKTPNHCEVGSQSHVVTKKTMNHGEIFFSSNLEQNSIIDIDQIIFEIGVVGKMIGSETFSTVQFWNLIGMSISLYRKYVYASSWNLPRSLKPNYKKYKLPRHRIVK